MGIRRLRNFCRILFRYFFKNSEISSFKGVHLRFLVQLTGIQEYSLIFLTKIFQRFLGICSSSRDFFINSPEDSNRNSRRYTSRNFCTNLSIESSRVFFNKWFLATSAEISPEIPAEIHTEVPSGIPLCNIHFSWILFYIFSMSSLWN